MKGALRSNKTIVEIGRKILSITPGRENYTALYGRDGADNHVKVSWFEVTDFVRHALELMTGEPPEKRKRRRDCP
jgi:hypothetical protein